jgi:signal transduction histidine kinase
MQREKLNTLGSIAAEVAHEIRNPLVSIGGFAQRLKQKFPDLPECEIILSESERLENILSRIRSYLEPVEINAKECSVNTIITDCVNLLAPETKARHLECVLDLAERLPAAYVDPEVLAQIFINIVRNAVEVMDNGGGLFVKSFEMDQDLHIEFKNKAPGLKIEHPDALFMPFAEGGKNFGLSLCYRLLKDMGGLLTFTQENDYMIFTVSVPKTVQPNPEKAVHDGAEQERPCDWAIYG